MTCRFDPEAVDKVAPVIVGDDFDDPPADLESAALDGLLGSIEFVESGCPTPEPPEAPAFPLAA